MNKVIENDLIELSKRPIDSKKLENKAIIIFGINSLIGRYLGYYLLFINEKFNLNMKIIGTARNIEKTKYYFKNFLSNPDFKIIIQDVENPINYTGNIDYIIDTAGYASAYHIVNQPVDIIKANTIGTINILEFAKSKNVENVLFTSTREVYGKVIDKEKIDEKSFGSMNHIEVRNCYPESKKISENLFISYNEQYGIPYTILRIAHTYGPTMTLSNDGRVMSDFLNFYVNNKNIVLNSSGTAVRSFCYITDTIYGIVLALINSKNEIYNLSNETEPYEIKDVAEMIVNTNPKKNLKVEFNISNDEKVKKGYNKIPVVPMDTKKIEKLGWKPNVGLAKGINRTIQYFEMEGEH